MRSALADFVRLLILPKKIEVEHECAAFSVVLGQNVIGVRAQLHHQYAAILSGRCVHRILMLHDK